MELARFLEVVIAGRKVSRNDAKFTKPEVRALSIPR